MVKYKEDFAVTAMTVYVTYTRAERRERPGGNEKCRQGVVNGEGETGNSEFVAV